MKESSRLISFGSAIILLLAIFIWPNQSYAMSSSLDYYGFKISINLSGAQVVGTPSVYLSPNGQTKNIDALALLGNTVKVAGSLEATNVGIYLDPDHPDYPYTVHIRESTISVGTNHDPFLFYEYVYPYPWHTTSVPFSCSSDDPSIRSISVGASMLGEQCLDDQTVTWPQRDANLFLYISLEKAPASLSPENYGTPEDNPHTVFRRGKPLICEEGSGAPVYWVNTATLDLVVQDTEFSTGGMLPVAFSRTYNSASSGSGMFGRGWSFAYESRMLNSSGDENGTVFYFKGSGQGETYAPSSQVTNPDSSTTVTYESTSKGRFDKLEGVFTGTVSESYYLFEEKSSRLTYRYEHTGIDGEGNQVYRLTSISDRNGNTVVLAYNGDGTLASVTDAAGRTTSFAYDANDRCISMTVPDGGAANYSYDSDGHFVQSVDLAGLTSTFTYNADHAMTSLSTEGKTVTFSYDESGGWKHISGVVDPLGHTTSYSADGWSGGDITEVTITEPGGGTMKYRSSDGKTTTVTNQEGFTVSTTAYNDDGLPSSVTFLGGSSATYEYDSRGNVTQQTSPAGAVTQMTYDSNDNLTAMVDAMGKSWNYAYDSHGNLISETTPLGRTTAYTRDGKGLITRTTLPDGAKYDFTYDANGNMISETDPTGKTTTYAYDAQGVEMTSTTNPRGYTTSFQYDANGRITKTTFPDGKAVSYGYNCCSPTTITDQAGNTTTRQRNSVLKLVKETDFMGNQTNLGYNADDDKNTLTTPLNRTFKFGYDAGHRLTSNTSPLGTKVSYAYDNRDNLTLLTDEKGNATAMAYDVEGRITSLKDPLNNTIWSFTRDSLGRVSAFTNAKGQTVTYEYDNDGRITKKKHDGNAVATYSYPTNGYLSSVNDDWGTTSMSYDAAGRVTQIDYPAGKSLGVTYDDGGNIASLSYPGGLTVTYSYDNLNILSRIDFGGQYISFVHDAVWNLTGEARSNGVTSTYTADANKQLTSLKSSKGSSTIISQTLTRDKDGRITGESGVRPLAPDLQATTVSAAYNAANGLTTMGSDAYTYDNDGNLTAISGSRSLSATYDPENRPTSITLGGVQREYLYDGLGRRVRIQSGGNTRNLHHDHLGRLLFETNGSGQLSAVYIYAGGMLVAQGDGSGNYLFPLRDKTGNTLALTDQSGTVVAAYAYGPYGAGAGKTGSATTPFTYVGAFGVMDEGDDLYFMKNRYYDAVSSRFLQRDPIGFAGGINLYQYVGSNPVDSIDPEGATPAIAAIIEAALMSNPYAATAVATVAVGSIFFTSVVYSQYADANASLRENTRVSKELVEAAKWKLDAYRQYIRNPSVYEMNLGLGWKWWFRKWDPKWEHLKKMKNLTKEECEEKIEYLDGIVNPKLKNQQLSDWANHSEYTYRVWRGIGGEVVKAGLSSLIPGKSFVSAYAAILWEEFVNMRSPADYK